MAIARVALDLPVARLFDYLDPHEARIGSLVQVPFGRGTRVGVVVERGETSAIAPDKLKAIVAALDPQTRLPDDLLNLARFAADYYHRPIGEVLAGVLPPRFRRAGKIAREPDRLSITAAGRSALAAARRPSTRRTVLGALAQAQALPLDSLAGLAPNALAAARALLREGLAAEADEPAGITASANAHALNADQAAACERIVATLGSFVPHLLFGVTGSGKTEVYLNAVRAALDAGKQALVLVPEINLTPQLGQAFAERFPHTRIALLHSALADNERANAWLDAASGRARIVLGTRLAVFAPFRALGLLVVDEEHDASFKQQEGVRYSARDLAVVRARLLGVPIVLASATPSLESYANAQAGRYRLLRLPARARAGARLPAIRVIDVREDASRDGLSPVLVDGIAARLARGEQSLVFLNRRGYAPVLACSACGWVADCTRCAAHLVVHLADRRLRCHHCGDTRGIPRGCPSCGNVDLAPFGRGTQRLEDAIVARFQGARILRIDSDSARGKGRWDAMIERIRAGDVDILVGTQMLAKGHDFPRLTLVGILGADAALMAADYRAPERLFAQLQQVAGRAGRADLAGEVLIQTRYPTHPLYRAVVSGDYAAFAQAQLAERAQAGFPPAVAEAVLRAEGRAPDRALAFLRQAVAAAPEPASGITLYDPVEMSMPRLAGWFRAHVLVQSPVRRELQGYLAEWSARLVELGAGDDVRWHIDVDPTEF